jgi:hypothetical protein
MAHNNIGAYVGNGHAPRLLVAGRGGGRSEKEINMTDSVLRAKAEERGPLLLKSPTTAESSS